MDRTGPKMGFRSPEGGKIDRTGPKMGFRKPKGEKKCQKWIEQVQKASISEILKMGISPTGDKYGDIPGDTTTWGYPLLIPGDIP